MPNTARPHRAWSLPTSRLPLATAHLFISAASLLLAAALLIIFWPGLATNDTGHRLCLADAMLCGASPGHPNPRPGFAPLPDTVYQHVFPPMMSVVAAGLRGLTGTWGFMTLLQCWWLFASLGVLAQRVLGARLGTLAWLVIIAVPFVWNTAIAMLPDAWVAASLCTMLASLLALQSSTRKPAWLIAFSLSALVFLGFRHNSITVLPVFAVAGGWLWLQSRASPHRANTRRAILAGALSLLGAFVFAKALPRALPWQDADVPATIMVWEHASMLRLANDEALTARHSLNDVARAANALDPATATTRALAQHDWVMFNTIVYGPDAPLPARAIRNDGTAARAAFWKLLREEPLLYARAKFQIWRTVLGLRHAGPVLFITADENGPVWTHQYGAHLGLSGPLAPNAPTRILTLLQRVTTATLALWMPYLWFSLALLALAIALARRSRALAPGLLLLAAAAAYYAGFLILSPAFEWRYFLPSFVLLLLAILALLRSPLDQ
jgi:hypothetical protein